MSEHRCYRTVIRVIEREHGTDRVLVEVVGRDRLDIVTEDKLGVGRVRSGDRLIGEVSLAAPTDQVEFKNVTRMQPPGPEILKLFSDNPS